MADNILRLRVQSDEYDAKLKKAAEGIRHLADVAHRSGGELTGLEKAELDYVRGLGFMETKSRTAAGSVRELESTFKELKVVYTQLNDQEKKGDFGRALNASLEQLKQRAIESRKELNDVAKELGGTQSKGIDLSGAIQTLGSKFGISSEALSMLSTGTVAYTAVLGGLTTAVIAGTKAWADYNAELAKQDQITTVTTGLKGEDANRMTDKARALSDTYGVDFRETINAANTLMTQFGKTGDEAIRLLRNGMQGMIQGDGPKLLSMIQQYAPAFRDAGIEASQLVAIIQNSEGGIFTDQNMNAIVMGIKNIRLMTKATSDALAQLGIDGNKMSQQLSDGSLTIFDALKQVAGAISNVDSNSKAAGEVMQQVFGRQGAMAGTKLGEAIATLNINLDETKRQTGEVGQSYDDLYEANVKLNQAIRDCFEYDGWDQMATGIKANLVGALASVLEITVKIKDSWVGDVGRTIFDTMTDAALKVSGPLGTVLSLLKNINSENGKGNGGNNGGIVYSDIDKTLQYIGNGANQQERETRYDKAIAQLRHKLDNIGKERLVNNADGSVSFKIDSQDVQEQKRAALERRISMLEKQRDSVVNKPDTPPVEPVKPLPPTKPTKTTSTTTPAQQAAKNIKTAEQEYSRALEKAALEVQGGTITEAQQKQKQLHATEALWSAYGKASDTVGGTNADYKARQEQLGQEIVKLGGEVKTATEAQKAAEKSARELEQAQKKLADAQRELATAQQTGNLKDVYKAQEKVTSAQTDVNRLQKEITQVVNVVPGRVELPQIPEQIEQTISTKVGQVLTPEIASEIFQTISTRLGDIVTPDVADSITQVIDTRIGEVVTPDIAEEITQVVNVVPGKVELPQIPKTVKPIEVPVTTANIDAFIGNLKERISQSDVGTDLYKNLTSQLADATMLGNVIDFAVKNGVDMAQFDPASLWQKIFGDNPGDYIEPSEWEEIRARIEEILGKPIKINVNTGSIAEDGKKMTDDWKNAASAIQSVGSAMAAIEDPAAKVMGTIAQAVASIALGAGQAIEQAGNGSAGGPWGWIAFAAAATATMISTIASIHSATGYANGGIVDGRGGGFVGGTAYSGDQVGNVRLDSGELVLNRSQQSTLAESLESRGSDIQSFQPYVSGENVYLGINNHLGRSGQGELVTTDMLRRIGLM